MEFESLLTILLSWASHLSGYAMPSESPEVRFEQHAFFVENVCGGKECNVVGWYNDADIVYIDEQYRNVESGFASGLVVHEFTHYLQHKSGEFESLSCEDSIGRPATRPNFVAQNRPLVEIQFVPDGRKILHLTIPLHLIKSCCQTKKGYRRILCGAAKGFCTDYSGYWTI